MATLGQVNPGWVRNESGAFQAVHRGIPDGAATWKTGEFLRQDGDKLLYEGTTGAANGIAADAIMYQALTDLDAVVTGETEYVTVGVIAVDDVYEINEYSTTASAATIGQEYAMHVASNVCTVDTTDGTNVVFKCVQPTWRERAYEDVVADVYPRMLVSVLQTAIEAART